jgi:chromosome partitioning protein
MDRLSTINDVIVSHDEFDILPASENLANNNNRQTLLEAPRSRERLGLALDEINRDYDTVLIDTPPSLGVLTDNALVASTNVIVPVIPEELNANSLRIFSKQLRSLENSYAMDINRIAIVANRVEHNNGEHNRVIEGIESTYDIPLFTVRKRTDLSRSIENDCSIFGFAKDNSRVRDAQATFNELADLVEATEVVHQ